MLPSFVLRVAAPFVLLLVGVGCDAGGAASDAAEAPVHLAAGASLVVEAPPGAWESSNASTMSVTDVSRDGNRIAVIVATSFKSQTTWHFDSQCTDYCPPSVGSAGGATELNLFVSDDSGASWKAHALTADTWQGDWFVGIHLWGGHAVIEGVRSGQGITLREWNLDTDQYVPNAALDEKTLSPRFFVANGAQVTATSKDNGVAQAQTVTWDLDRRKLSMQTAALGAGYFCGPNWHALSAGKMSAYCTSPTEQLTCVTTVDVNGGQPSSQCAPRGYWPTKDDFFGPEYVTPRGLVMVGAGSSDGLAAAAMTPTNGVELVQLGAGDLATDTAFLHPRFGGLLKQFAVGLVGRGTLIDLEPDVAHTFEEPVPCSDASCGTSSRLDWLLPLDAGRYLGFFVVNSRKADSNGGPTWHEHLYTRPVTLKALADLAPPAASDPLASFPGAVPGSKVSLGCYKAESCGLLIGSVFDCVNYWTAVPQTNAARVAMLANLKSDCATFKGVWPAELVPPYTHPIAPPACGSECPSCGVTRCEGNVAITCPTVGAVGSLKNCGDWAQNCTKNERGAICTPVNVTAVCSGVTPEECSGGYMITCHQGDPQATNCADIGLTTCALTSPGNLASCVPAN